MPLVLVVPVVLIAMLALGAFALRGSDGHAAELREALLLLLMLVAVSAGVGLATLCPGRASGETVPVTGGGVSA